MLLPEPLDATDLEVVREALGLPPIAEITPEGGFAGFTAYDVRFGEGSDAVTRRWMVEQPGALRRPFATALAAHALLAGAEALPVTSEYRVAGPPFTARRVALRATPAGPTAEQVVRAGVLAREVAFERLGAVVAAVQDVWTPNPALHADSQRFVPERCWADVVARQMALARQALDEACVEMPVAARVFEALEQARRDLPGDLPARLVHGALGLSVLRLDPELRVAEVDGWESARAGDPLSEWGPLLNLHPADLTAALRGAGNPDLAAAPHAAARLRVAQLLHVVELLAGVAVATARADWRDRCLWIERLRCVAEDALARDPLALLAGADLPAWTPPTEAGVARARLAELLRSPLGPTDAEALAAVVGLVELGDIWPDAVPAALGLLDRFAATRPGRPAPCGVPGAQPTGPLLTRRTERFARRVGAGAGELGPLARAGAEAWRDRCARWSASEPMGEDALRALAAMVWADPSLLDDDVRFDLEDLIEQHPGAAPPLGDAIRAVGDDPLGPLVLLGLAACRTQGTSPDLGSPL